MTSQSSSVQGPLPWPEQLMRKQRSVQGDQSPSWWLRWRWSSYNYTEGSQLMDKDYACSCMKFCICCVQNTKHHQKGLLMVNLQVSNHGPVCSCPDGYQGDPLSQCFRSRRGWIRNCAHFESNEVFYHETYQKSGKYKNKSWFPSDFPLPSKNCCIT